MLRSAHPFARFTEFITIAIRFPLTAAVALSALSSTPASASDLIGTWAGEDGPFLYAARIRRGTENPDVLVADLEVATRGCAGQVAVFGRPEEPNGTRMKGQSYTPDDPNGSECRVDLMLGPNGTLRMEEIEGCLYWHGASCEFRGEMKRQ